MASASTPSVNELTSQTVELKPIIKAQISGNLVTSGISDVASDRYSKLRENPYEEDDYGNYY